MIRYSLLLLLLALMLPAPAVLRAQPDADAAADTMMSRNMSLFDTTALAHPLGESESDPLDRLRPAGWAPEFPVPVRHIDYLGLQDSPPLLFSYDRADMAYLGVGTDIPAALFLTRRLQGYLGFGYAFGSHYWQAQAGLKRDFLNRDAPLRLSLEGHILTDTRDAWKMGVDENTAFALIAGIDARDYFQRRGFSAGIQQFFNRRIGLKAEYRNDTYRNSHREAGWSLFGPHQPFTEVPPITEGKMNSVAVNVIADYASQRSWNDGQYSLEAEAEFGSMDASFQQYVVDARAKITLVDDMLWLAVRGRAGSTTGQAPIQKLFTIGGFGTLPGFEQNAYGGNRMLLLQTDLLLSPFSHFGLRVIFSNDFGSVATASPNDGALAGFADNLSAFKYSTGIYIGTPTGKFRMGFAFRTDIFADPTFVIRVSQPF